MVSAGFLFTALSEPRPLAWTGLAFLLSGALACGEEADRDVACGWTGEAHESSVDTITIGTCVPEGELFESHFDCSLAEGPCPHEPMAEASSKVESNAERDADPDLDWVQAQLGACSCSCCHQTGRIAADLWSWNFRPIWVESMVDSAVENAVGPGGREDYFGGDPGANNGFTRTEVGFPTTDGLRMRAFFEREFSRRQPAP